MQAGHGPQNQRIKSGRLAVEPMLTITAQAFTLTTEPLA
jgi:hypothetical protein